MPLPLRQHINVYTVVYDIDIAAAALLAMMVRHMPAMPCHYYTIAAAIIDIAFHDAIIALLPVDAAAADGCLPPLLISATMAIFAIR